MTAAAPSGVVTFLFTDVKGSTRRWESDADDMRAALAEHDEVLRAAIEAHGRSSSSSATCRLDGSPPLLAGRRPDCGE